MSKKVIAWGSGNVGRPAIRAVLSHQGLELAGVVVSSPAKDGVDAGALIGAEPTGITASRDWQSQLAAGADAVVYTATGDTRPEEALADIIACLEAGCNVVTSSCYPLLYPSIADFDLRGRVDAACIKGGSSVLVSGIDPGWGQDILPLLLSGVVADIEEIRCQEIFNYALYDAPAVVRDIIGFGQSMDDLPPMLYDFSLRMVWEPMIRLLGDGLGRPVDDVRTKVERRALEKTIQVDGMGEFTAGSQGAFRFEVQGIIDGQVRYVIEHITRIDDGCAPDWPYPAEGQGGHTVLISGSPDLSLSFHANDRFEVGPAAGGNATAANRLVNLIPALCEAPPGICTPLDLPPVHGGMQLR